MNKNAHLLIQEAQLKRSQIVSPSKDSIDSSPAISLKGSISMDSIFSQAVVATSDEHLVKLTSVSEMSEQILSNGQSPNIPQIKLIFEASSNDTDDQYLVKPSVKLSRQVEHFGKMIHERNAAFVHHCRKVKGSLVTQGESFYFDDEDIRQFRLQVSDVDLPVVNEDSSETTTLSSTLEPDQTNLNVNVDSSNTSETSFKRSLSMEEHAKWNKFLKDISQLTIEIDDQTEEFL